MVLLDAREVVVWLDEIVEPALPGLLCLPPALQPDCSAAVRCGARSLAASADTLGAPPFPPPPPPPRPAPSPSPVSHPSPLEPRGREAPWHHSAAVSVRARARCRRGRACAARRHLHGAARAGPRHPGPLPLDRPPAADGGVALHARGDELTRSPQITPDHPRSLRSHPSPPETPSQITSSRVALCMPEVTRPLRDLLHHQAGERLGEAARREWAAEVGGVVCRHFLQLATSMLDGIMRGGKRRDHSGRGRSQLPSSDRCAQGRGGAATVREEGGRGVLHHRRGQGVRRSSSSDLEACLSEMARDDPER